MPEHPQSIPAHILDLDAEDVRAALPPIIDLEQYERFEGFRETPPSPTSYTRPPTSRSGPWGGCCTRACWNTGTSGRRSPREAFGTPPAPSSPTALEPHEARLSKKCPAIARQVKEIADSLEQELGTWRGEEEDTDASR
jgi:hypothetical protein